MQAEFLSALPVVLSLVLIEGLLSIDNALAIASMASALPVRQQKKALRYGIVGAYVMRGLCLAIAAWIASNPLLKVLGGLYLLYLMVSHFWSREGSAECQSSARQSSFWPTVVWIEIMDLALSLDNVVAAVSLDPRLWVVVTGVFIGILALRFVSVGCLSLIRRFPILTSTAFVLVGYVGALTIVDLLIEVGGVIRFGGIFAIVVASCAYDAFARRRAERLAPIL